MAPMFAKQTADYIINNGGGTFYEDGSVLDARNGYLVSLPDHEYRVPLKYFNYAHVEAHAEAIKDELSNGAYFGAWVDAAGYVVLDASVYVSHFGTAIALGLKWNQDAIYDYKNGVSISLDCAKG